jgi:twitching motility protein PilT
MAEIDRYLKNLLQKNGSDLHLIASHKPCMRINGSLGEVEDLPLLASSEIEKMANEIFSKEQNELLPQSKNIDFSYEMKDNGSKYRFRGNAYYQKLGLNIILRSIPKDVPSLEYLGLPPRLAMLTEHHQGLILATGPAGCGKTSTLAALVEIVNQKKSAHIITVEDPIEYVFLSKKSLINQRQVGKDVDSFQLALKGALREDPDVILIGELRDLETIQLAITAAETGHLVMGTLHTQSAIKTIDRVIDSFPVDQQAQIRTMLSESLKGVISQKLIPKKDGTGRVAAVEILIGNLSVANTIREGKTYKLESVMQTGKNLGMIMLDASIKDLYEKGIISMEEALLNVRDSTTFKQNVAAKATSQS